jgi:two-component system, sensor histidine kinase and response regulator
MEPTGMAKRLHIETRGDTCASFDPDRIAQMLTNLVGNALQHGAQEHPVTLLVDGARAESVEISVHNHGSIPSEALPALFQPFRGMSVSDRSGGQGLGLGLHIVRHIASLHGGSVQAENVASDGTVFRVVLPRTRAR